MSLPKQDDLKNMDFVYLGQPFVEIPSKDTLNLYTMDYSYLGQPFVRNMSLVFGILKRWTGSAWIKGKLKKWTGSAWIDYPLRIFSNR